MHLLNLPLTLLWASYQHDGDVGSFGRGGYRGFNGDDAFRFGTTDSTGTMNVVDSSTGAVRSEGEGPLACGWDAEVREPDRVVAFLPPPSLRRFCLGWVRHRRSPPLRTAPGFFLLGFLLFLSPKIKVTEPLFPLKITRTTVNSPKINIIASIGEKWCSS